ncbi:MAG: TIM barrel protein [Armatimonadota bacterium]|nr:TIM barrel protein [bacterium]
MKVDICLEMVFTDLPTEERIARIAKNGFNVVEFWFHDATFDGTTCATSLAKDPAAIRQACKASGVRVNNLVVNAWDGSFGGSPVDSNDHGKYLERFHEVMEFAKAIDCKMAITCTGCLVPNLSRHQMRANLEKVYGEAARIAQKNDFMLVVEPLNLYVDHPGYYLDSSFEAAEIVRAISSPNFKMLYDVYHMQIMEGNLISNIEENIDIIGHFHAAGVPGRNELNIGELNYINIIKKIDSLGYAGSFGLEYAPLKPDSSASLASLHNYLSEVM